MQLAALGILEPVTAGVSRVRVAIIVGKDGQARSRRNEFLTGWTNRLALLVNPSIEI
jgi:hypothetical protein